MLTMFLRAFSSQSSMIEPGGVYRHRGVGSVEEVARVLEITPDKLGVLHVRFELKAMHGAHSSLVEIRTLGVEAFQARFREKVEE